jgi:hypothetical protein
MRSSALPRLSSRCNLFATIYWYKQYHRPAAGVEHAGTSGRSREDAAGRSAAATATLGLLPLHGWLDRRAALRTSE